MAKRNHTVTTREGYAIWSTSYDAERNPLIMTEEPRVTALLESLPPPLHALDVATGTGRWALNLAKLGVDVTAIDESPDMLALARKKARQAGVRIRFDQRDLQEELPFPSGHFDLVVCALALCHVVNLETAITECSRVLKRGGHLLITDFHPQAIVNGWETTIFRGEDAYILPTVRHSRSAYLRAIEMSGCDVIHVEDVPVRDQPEEAILRGEDVDEFMRQYGDWPFCLIVLARRQIAVG